MRRATLTAVAIAGGLMMGAAACGSGLDREGDAHSAAPRPMTALSVYFERAGELQALRRQVPATKAVATAALRQLLKGPSPSERLAGYRTAVPAGTRLQGVTIQNGLATVNLSGRFASGGGSLSIRGRLAELTFTATQFPTVRGVRLELEGRPVSVFSGEGLVLDHPLQRSAFYDVLPAILLEGPLTGDQVRSPLRVRGSADVFEATFRVRLIRPGGAVVAERVVRASAGTGMRGDFDVRLRWPGKLSGPARLQAEVQSPKDGQWRAVAESRVTLAP